MKKSAELLGLDVFSIQEGKKLGVIKNFVVDASKGEVAALVVDDGKWYEAAKLLPFGKIRGIADTALTVDDCASLTTVESYPELEDMLKNNVNVIGSKIITTVGKICGIVSEIQIDSDNGKIINCEVTVDGASEGIFSADTVVTFGQDVVVIQDDEIVYSKAVESAEPSVQPATPPVSQASNFDLPPISVVPEQPVPVPVEQPPIAPVTPEISNPATEVQKFDDKHRQFLLGKQASRKIETDTGVVIVEQGGEITEEVIQKARLSGKFIELTMSVAQ